MAPASEYALLMPTPNFYQSRYVFLTNTISMKIALFFIAALALCSVASAQNNWVSVTINTLSRATSSTSNNDYDETTKSLHLLPSIGYYRLLNEQMGIGCDFGYAHYTEHSTHVGYFAGAPGDELIENIDQTYNEYFICPSVFEIFPSDNYLFTASLGFPVSYIPVQNYTYRREQTGPNSVEDGSLPGMMQLTLGAFLNGGVQRRLFGGLYFGPQLGVGVYHRIAKGDEDQTAVVSNNNVVTQTRERMQSQHQTSTWIDVRPVISVTYRF
jgi:hypothetical protein